MNAIDITAINEICSNKLFVYFLIYYHSRNVFNKFLIDRLCIIATYCNIFSSTIFFIIGCNNMIKYPIARLKINSDIILIKSCIHFKENELVVDFTGSSGQVKGGINTNEAITYSAALYVLTTLLGEDVPINSGIMRAVKLVLPPKSIVNASKPAGLAGGNVETSQRIVDVLLGAFSKALPKKIPASSQGTMNNITFGGEGFSYYETLGGGTGAGSGYNGKSGVHSHMTNSLNTPVEALEIDFPIEIENYSIRENSGGRGLFKGGNGLIRSYQFNTDSHVSILSERRKNPPHGIQGGDPGKKGENILIRNEKKIKLGSKVNIEIKAGDTLVIKTPGVGFTGFHSAAVKPAGLKMFMSMSYRREHQLYTQLFTV